jgi:hypothetical protein
MGNRIFPNIGGSASVARAARSASPAGAAASSDPRCCASCIRAQIRRANTGGRHADPDRGNDLVAVADHGHGHCAHAEFEFFIADAEAVGRHNDQITLQEKKPRPKGNYRTGQDILGVKRARPLSIKRAEMITRNSRSGSD